MIKIASLLTFLLALDISAKTAATIVALRSLITVDSNTLLLYTDINISVTGPFNEFNT